MTLSLVIVSYNVREFLEQAIRSIQKALDDVSYEIIVVDNASSDGTIAFLQKQNNIVLIQNDVNVGFGKANNQGFEVARGEYICAINPDTIVQEDTFKVLIDFISKHKNVGAVGCKILNPDGSLQLACRRSFPTPWVAFTKISGLAGLFPKSKLFGRYNLTYLNPEQVSKVEAISGSFMLLPRSTIEKVGGFDESFFMYGEDLDWCYRIRKAGLDIYYVPDTKIIHFKGESSKKSPFEQRRLFYEAMRLFVEKHFSKGSAFLPSRLLILAIWMRALLAFFSGIAGFVAGMGTDLVFMTLSIALGIYWRFSPQFPWNAFLIVHLVYSLVWIFSLAAHGVYTKNRFSIPKSFSAVFIGLIVNSALTFFFNQYGFSRAVVLYSGLLNLVAVPGWRFLLKMGAKSGFGLFSHIIPASVLKKRSLIIGDPAASEHIIHRIGSRTSGSSTIVGIVLIDDEPNGKIIAGVPVVGNISRLPDIIAREKIKEVIFTTDKVPYDKILSTIASSHGSQIDFKLIPSNLDVIIGKANIDYIDDIPFVGLDYKLHAVFYRSVKRLFDISFAALLFLILLPVYLMFRFINAGKVTKKTFSGPGGELALSYFSDNLKYAQAANLFLRLLDIFKGDISFVGSELRQNMESGLEKSLSLKPGITGLEQINNKLNLTQEDRNRYNLYYIKNYSPLLDIEILIKSVFN